MLPKCCAGHQKTGTFQHFSPTFQKLFLKRDLFDSFNDRRTCLGWDETPPFCRNQPQAMQTAQKRARRPFGQQSHHASLGIRLPRLLYAGVAWIGCLS